jgi:hypothetical protein
MTCKIELELARGVERLDRVSEGDRHFFARHQGRKHRLRQADGIEIEHQAIIAGGGMEPTPGKRWFTIVWQVVPGVRFQGLIALPETTDPDISESECKRIFDRHFVGKSP